MKVKPYPSETTKERSEAEGAKDCPCNIPYKERLGVLLWLSQGTRTDITVCEVCTEAEDGALMGAVAYPEVLEGYKRLRHLLSMPMEGQGYNGTQCQPTLGLHIVSVSEGSGGSTVSGQQRQRGLGLRELGGR